MESKYHFVKVRPNYAEDRIAEIKRKGSDKEKESLKGKWYLMGDTIEAINDHWEKYASAYIREGMCQMVRKFQKQMESVPAGHYSNNFAYVSEITSQCKQIPLWQAALEIENESLHNRINDFNKGHINQLLSTDLSILMYKDNLHVIMEEKYSDKLTFPDEEKPSISDVRYIQWNGGEHWYAKIGKLDVVDRYNNQKWNTKEEAEQAAKWYIEKYY